jgi:hypothetical protein
MKVFLFFMRGIGAIKLYIVLSFSLANPLVKK